MKKLILALGLLGLAACWRLKQEEIMKPNAATKPVAAAADPRSLTDEDWRAKLSPTQYHVLREAGTEAPGSGALLSETRNGTYRCGACGAELFKSETKYESCGWPSFWDAVPGAVALRPVGGAEEALCARCDSHLGHLFDDGPPPTGKRY